MRGGLEDSDKAESRVRDVPLRRLKIGMVEDVEEFAAKFQLLRFGQFQLFQQTKVPGCPPRTMKEPPIRIPQLPYNFRTEKRGVKVRVG